MNNKEKSLWEMCERECEFCHFLILIERKGEGREG